MKKKIYLILIILIILLICNKQANAKVLMYSECTYDSKCQASWDNDTLDEKQIDYDCSPSPYYANNKAYTCWPYLNRFARITTKDNKNQTSDDKFVAVSSKAFSLAYGMGFSWNDNVWRQPIYWVNFPKCYLKGDYSAIDLDCTDDNNENGIARRIIESGYCPLGVRDYKKNEGKRTLLGLDGGYADITYAAELKTPYTFGNAMDFDPDSSVVLFGGEYNKPATSSAYLEGTKLIVYKVTKKDGEDWVIAEAYLHDEVGDGTKGQYAYVGPYISNLDNYLAMRAYSSGSNFFDIIDEKNLIISNESGYGVAEAYGCKAPGKYTNPQVNIHSDWRSDNYEVILSYDSTKEWTDPVNKNLYDRAAEWIIDKKSNGKATLETMNIIANFFNDNQTFVSECKEMNESLLNGTVPEMDSSQKDRIVKKIGEAATYFEEYYKQNYCYEVETLDNCTKTPSEGAEGYILKHIGTKYLNKEISSFSDLKYGTTAGYSGNVNSIGDEFRGALKKALAHITDTSEEKITFLNIAEYIPDYFATLYTTISYFNSENLREILDFNNEQIEIMDGAIEKMKKLAEDENNDELYGITPIVDCENLLGENLIYKINSYLNIVKIAVPILLIGLGIVDFTKALFSGSEEDMKKSQKKFISRIGIAIIFFLLPTMINLMLGLANKVWISISPNSCRIFERK